MLKTIVLNLFTAFFLSVSSHATSVQDVYVKLKPEDDVYRIVILGDSLADGLHLGMTRLNRGKPHIKTTRKSKVNTGLVRFDRYNWNEGARQIANSGKYQIAIVLLGLNDLQTIRESGKRHLFATESWLVQYKRRAETMMRDLKGSGMAVYWTGIPITSPGGYQQEYRYLNGIFKEVADKVGVRFVDTWGPLASQAGQYSPFWTDESGKKKQIRKKDGIHFTTGGYSIFASIVNDVVQNDLNLATATEQTR